jgi:hypothetical protein
MRKVDMLKQLIRLSLVLIMILFFAGATITAEEYLYNDLLEQPKKPLQALDDLYKAILNAELSQARETVYMLDELYKTFIVLITGEYVNDPSVLPAATLSKRVFEAMGKKGWHQARLLDATGTPFNPDNNPKDKFERDAIKAIISGKKYFERVEKIGDKDYLRAATAVSAVMGGCIICHPDKKVGDLLGAISFSIPLK